MSDDMGAPTGGRPAGSLTSLEREDWSERAFLARYPEYLETGALDRLRAEEYAHVDGDGVVYLDYTGSGVAARSQFRAHADRLAGTCYGNPHSEHPPSRAATELVDSARRAVLEYFNASPDEYVAIFTQNATGACRLVGEAYPFDHDRPFVLTFDNHNSVNGIREFAKAGGAHTQYVQVDPPELRTEREAVTAALDGGRGLFAFPAQSNFTGVQHPLDWIELAHERGYDVLLDAAAFIPTNRLDLAAVHPDFVPVSWYKLFGYPTGVGCLVARREALARLRRPWFAGGTIQAVSVQGDWHALADDESAFEDGTLNFLSIPDVEFGLSWIRGIGIDDINRRVRCLTGWLLERLAELRHGNGRPMARVYGPTGTNGRGATIALNLLDPDGALVDERLVAKESSEQRFAVRTGCFCNPGAGEGAFGVNTRLLQSAIGTRTLQEYLDLLSMPTGGAIRVSFGVASSFSDAQRFLRFAERTYRDRRADSAGLEPRLRC
jgi:selenocysteine lyase/cysteine desulfurase